MSPPHVLLTAWAFPPARTSGVYRAAALAEAFLRDGWAVTVLTAPREVFASTGRSDPSLLTSVDPRVTVVEVPFRSAATDVDLGAWTRSRARTPELWNAVTTRRELRSFPESGFGSWRSGLEAAAARVHRETPVDIAVGTANPHVDFVPGWSLYERFGVPHVMDYRDAWTFDVFTGERPPGLAAGVAAWEARLIGSARQVWFVNEPIRDWHASAYPADRDRMRVVPNGFDIPAGSGTLGVPWRREGEDGLDFGYVGTINTGQFPLVPLLAGWRRARALDPVLARSRIVLRGYLGRDGVADPVLAAWLREAESDGIVYGGPVAKARVHDVYASFDALVLALASGPGVTSGKVFEYVGTGLPVVSVHDPGSAAATVMRDSPVWAGVGWDEESVARAFCRAVSVVGEQTGESRNRAIGWGARWERQSSLAPHVAELRRLVEERAGDIERRTL